MRQPGCYLVDSSMCCLVMPGSCTQGSVHDFPSRQRPEGAMSCLVRDQRLRSCHAERRQSDLCAAYAAKSD